MSILTTSWAKFIDVRSTLVLLVVTILTIVVELFVIVIIRFHCIDDGIRVIFAITAVVATG